MAQSHLHQATSRRRKKSYPVISAAIKKKRKKIRSKQRTNDESDSDSTDSNKAAQAHTKQQKSNIQMLFAIGMLSVIAIFCFSVIYIEYSKRLQRQFELHKYTHETEMKKIALERAKIDAELQRLQQNLKEIEYNKESMETKQKHEMEMELMKLRHKREFETLKIESERESEAFTLKMHKMKSLLAETDKKLAMEQEQNGMVLKHETERLKLQSNNKLEEVKSIDNNKRILTELKITKSSELFQNALSALNSQVNKEKEALALKRKECFSAKRDERDSWFFTSGKYSGHANEICKDYKLYRDDVNKLIEHLSSLTQQRAHLIEEGNGSEAQG